MKIVTAAVLAAALLVAAAPGSAATPLAKKVAALQAQVNAIKKQNATLKKQVTQLQKDDNTLKDGVGAAIVFSGCLAAVTADAFQNTWSGTNQATGKTTFNSPGTVGDPGLCTELRVLRQPAQVPPSIDPFNALLTLFTGRAAPAFHLLPLWIFP
jgi:cell division protein FtsB